MIRLKRFRFIPYLMATCFSLAAWITSNATEVKVDSFIYSVSRFWGHGLIGDTGALITGIVPGDTIAGELIIPDSILYEGKKIPVVGIGEFSELLKGKEPAFFDNDEITSVHLPESFRFFGNAEFLGCHNIEKYSVDPANPYFMAEDDILYEINYPYDESSTWELVRFPSARELSTLVIPSRAYNIATGAFAANDYLRNIIISGEQTLNSSWQLGNKTIENVDCSSSNRYSSPEEGIVLYGNLFKSACPGLIRASYTLPDNIRYIEDGAFCESAIREITFPESLDNPLACYLFLNSAIEKVNFMGNLPNRVGDACFMNASSLSSISLSGNDSGTLSIATSAFKGCSSLESITFEGYVKTVEIERYAFMDCTTLSEFPLTSKMSVPELNSYAFTGCSSLKSFPLSCVNEIELVPGYQFEGAGLTYVNWPSALTDVPYGCFKDCKDLTKINLKMTTSDIYAEAFAGSGLTAISLMGVEWYSSSAFSDCQNLSRVYFPINDKDFPYYWHIDFKAPLCEVIVNNPRIQNIDDQEQCEGAEIKLYMSSFSPSQKLGDNWSCIYVPGKASEIYSSLSSSEVREMFSYTTKKDESKVRIDSPAAGVRITGVTIEGVEAELIDGWWTADCTQSEDKKMNVTVNYTVYGNPMQTAYTYLFEDSESDIREVDSVEKRVVRRVNNEEISLNRHITWNILDMYGRLILAGESDSIDISSLHSGAYILHFPTVPSESFKFRHSN